MGTSTTGATTDQTGSIWRRPAAALKVWAGELRQRESQLFLVLSLVIGGAVGAIVVAFIVLTEHVGAYMYPPGGLGLRRLFVPIVGSLITGFLLAKYFPQARGSGVPQTKTALFLQGGRISAKTVFGRFFCSAAALGCGISLGREGPCVQIGSGLASVVGRRLGLNQNNIKALVPVGAAAALAAAFNTPIAAVLFSLEEIMGDLHAPLLGSVVISAATSWVVLHLFLGDNPLFHVPAYQLTHPAEFGAYAILGVLGGFVSVGFVKMTLGMRMRLRRWPASTQLWQPAIGGLIVGIIGFFIPQVEGAGYTYVSQVLTGNFVLPIVAALVILKLVATASCYASGNTGGIFGPSLFMGAMLGGAMGTVVHHWFPMHTATAGAYALVGMGATFAGIIRTPLTSVFMIFELTRDYTIVVPLMIANMVSFYISWKLQPKPIYEALNEQDGIHLPDPEAERNRHSKTVAEVMRVVPDFVSPDTPLHDLTPHPFGGLYLVGQGEELLGVLRASDVATALDGQDMDAQVDSLMRLSPAEAQDELDEFPHVHADEPVEVALERMGTDKISMLPVLDRANVKHVRGVVLGDDILRSYGVPMN